MFSGVKYRHGFMVDQNKLIDKVPLNDETDTHKIASILAAEVEPGDVLCLYGDLGVGKTSFARARRAISHIMRNRNFRTWTR